MKQHTESEFGQIYGNTKITVSKELEEKLKNVVPSSIKLAKALKAVKTLDLDKIRSVHFSK